MITCWGRLVFNPSIVNLHIRKKQSILYHCCETVMKTMTTKKKSVKGEKNMQVLKFDDENVTVKAYILNNCSEIC